MSDREQIEKSIQLIQNEIAKYVAQETQARLARMRYTKIKADLEKKLDALNANHKSKEGEK